MPNNLNKYDIDEQFTEKAWVDMRAKLDEALPVKNPIVITKWFSIAAIFCILCIGGYWLSQTNQKTSVVAKNVDAKHSSYVAPKVAIEKKKNQSPVLSEAKQAKTVLLNTVDKDNQLQRSKTKVLDDDKKEELPVEVVVADQATSLTNQTNINTQVFAAPSINDKLNATKKNIKTITKTTYENSNREAKIFQSQQQTVTKNQVENPNSQFNNSLRKENLQNTTLKIQPDSKVINQLVIIDQYLQSPTHSLSNILNINRSKAGESKNQWFTQKNDDEKLHPKTIHYGIKQGLSSDLTTESAIFAGALIDFNLNDKWFIECSPAYQFGKISREYEVQYDRLMTTDEIKTALQDTFYVPENPGETIPENDDQSQIEPQWTKDSLTLSLNSNNHSASIDLLLGYKITPKIETLIGLSAAKHFYRNASNRNTDYINEARNSLHANDLTVFQNKYSIAPKITMRYGIKERLYAEAFYQQNLIPNISEKYLTKNRNTNLDSPQTDSYFSRNFGLGFVYRFK